MHRKIIVIQGDSRACLAAAQMLTKNLHTISVSNYKQASAYLGQESDAVIFDLHEIFDANAFGAISGVIRGGGLMIILLAGQSSELLAEKFGSTNQKRFTGRFINLLFSEPGVKIIQAEDEVTPLPALEKSLHTKNNLPNFCISADQVTAVEAIVHVVKGHRRRPLVITSDRGRGKSAALGIAAAKLVDSGCQHITITAPSKKTADMVFKHAKIASNNHHNLRLALNFLAPDELLKQNPDTDLLMIDEAAAIPLPMLQCFLKRYSRIVFSSTQHGYEGSGRGFANRFKKILDKQTPGWKKCQLKTPVRWDENDPLERFTFNALLLDAEPENVPIAENINNKNLEFVRLDKEDLINNESLLKQLFGLLVAAHYQTRPSDLQFLLDDAAVSVYAALTAGNEKTALATAVIAREGGFDEKLASEIYSGNRRVKGHLVAQALAANVAMLNAPCQLGDRIVRIAVHPNLQNMGLGSKLLECMVDASDADYVSTSFGATPTLLNFWKKSGFSTVHVGVKRDASSGSHSVIMLQGKTPQGRDLQADAETRFMQSFPHILADTLVDLEAELVVKLFRADSSITINEAEMTTINAFTFQQRAYENSLYPLWKLVCKSLSDSIGVDNNLNRDEQQILIFKLLQKQSWETVIKKMEGKLSGQKQARKLLRLAVLKLIRQ